MAMGKGHRALFQQYVTALTVVMAVAEADARRRPNDTDGPRTDIFGWRGPPAADPRVIGVIRDFFFRCERLNRENEDAGVDEYVEPPVFVHEMLTGRHQALWDFVAELDFLPVGVNENEEWI